MGQSQRPLNQLCTTERSSLTYTYQTYQELAKFQDGGRAINLGDTPLTETRASFTDIR